VIPRADPEKPRAPKVSPHKLAPQSVTALTGARQAFFSERHSRYTYALMPHYLSARKKQ